MQPIVIPLSTTKIILLTLGSIVFVIVMYLLLQVPDLPPIMTLISYVGIVFFGCCGVYGAMKVFDRKPGLIVSDEGIVDNSSAAAAGLIRWTDIKDIELMTVSSQKFLSVYLHDSTAIIARQSWWRRQIMKLNMKYFGTPIHIASNSLRCNFQELSQIVANAFAEHRTK